MAIPPTRFTPEDLLKLEDEGLFELVEGRLVEKQMSSLANRTAGLVATSLNNFIENSGIGGAIIPEQTFQCFPHDPSLIRRPDVAFVAAPRMVAVPEEGHVPIAPDIAIEVISPNDKMYAFEEKFVDYRKAGIKLVWEVNPKFRFIRVHYLERAPERLEETDILAGAPVLPGFSIPVRELFPSIDVGKQ
jgi:Uma2 family endonuclease